METTMNRFEDWDNFNKKILADAIVYAIEADEISVQDLINHISIINPMGQTLDESAIDKTYKELYITLSRIHIIQNETQITGPGDKAKCIVNCIWMLDPDVKQLLNDSGYTDDILRKVFKELPEDQKIDGSAYLNSSNDWHIVDNNDIPTTGKLVVARIYDPTKIIAEDKDRKLFEETAVIAWYDNGSWTVERPHPYVEISTLINGDDIAEGAKVSHWREATEEEIDNWHHRYDPVNTYGYLDIVCDDDHKSDLYSALVYGNNLLEQFAKQHVEIKDTILYLASILSDLAGCIDRNEGVYNEPDDAIALLNSIIKSISSDDLKDSVVNHDYT